MNSYASVSSKTLSETELFSFLIQYASARDIPFALWRLPHSSVKHFLIAHSFQKLTKETVLEDLPPGFIFGPFDPNKEATYLPADLIFNVENGKWKQPETPKETASAMWLEKEFNAALKPLTGKKFPQFDFIDKSADFLILVKKCITEIAEGNFEKVVPSRIKRITLPKDFDILTAFEKLCDRYQHALVSYVNIPGQGSWLGASPELLVCEKNKTIFKTVALAGTLPYEDGVNLKSVAWTQKEIEEQALVERYIISCFKKIRLREYEEQGPKTVIAGNLMHLRSDFTVDMQATNFPQLGSIMLKLLHPTSAVCGMPLEPALKFLQANEGYDRSFYAGYLGPVNVGNDIHIFVNLRCMQLLGTEAILYAGAGVTIDSVPEKEFEETEIKFNTLLNVVF